MTVTNRTASLDSQRATADTDVVVPGPDAGADDRRVPGAVRALWALGLAGLALSALHGTVGLGPLGLDRSDMHLLYAGLFVLPAAVCFGRAVIVREGCAPWVLTGAGMLGYGAGWVYYTLALTNAEPPYPSPADGLRLGFYAALVAAMMMLTGRRLLRSGRLLWIDAVITALALAAVSEALLIDPIVSATAGKTAAVTVGIAYPLADLFLLTGLIGMLAASGWHAERRLVVLGAAFLILGGADSLYLYQSAVGQWHPGTLLDTAWLAAALLLSYAAWQPSATRRALARTAWPRMLLPLASTALAIGVLIVGDLDELVPGTVEHVSPAALVLAWLALIASMAGTVVTYREQRRLEGLARRDPLTGLFNRRELHRRLDRLLAAAERERATLALVAMDINGFKEVNDRRGHAEGDRVLRRVAGAIDEARRATDSAFRTGGDEFVALLPGSDAEGAEAFGQRVVEQVAALGEDIGIAYGVGEWPADGPSKEMLLLRADVAMYSHKTGRESIALQPRASRSVRSGDANHANARRRTPPAASDAEQDVERAQLRAYAEAVRESYVQGLRRAEELKQNYLATVLALASAVEAKDDYTGGHIHRVHDLGLLLAQAVIPEEADDPHLAYGFLLHDIGKLAVPDAVLNKPGRLDDREWELMRGHPEAGIRILSPIPFLGRALDVVLHHHERWDGTGYPGGLAGEQIPMWARIFAVVDTVDAITSDRPYRRCMPVRVALGELEKGAGSQFDPACVEAFHGLDQEQVQKLVECPEHGSSARDRDARTAAVV